MAAQKSELTAARDKEVNLRGSADLIDRYVYAVTRKLTARQRSDIDKELRSLIADMLDERAQGGAVTEEHVTEVLTELGPPGKLAVQYRETKRYLIGPDLFDLYWMILKIVAFWSFFGLSIAFLVQIILDPADPAGQFVDYLVSLFTIGVQVIAWVTVAFALMEYYGVKIPSLGMNHEGWKPSQLPPVPDYKSRIKVSSTVSSIVVAILFFILIVYSNLLGVHLNMGSSDYMFIPIFNSDTVRELVPVFYGLLVLMILRECIKLFFGQWNRNLAWSLLAVDVVMFVFYIILFRDQTIWNPHLMDDLLAYGRVTLDVTSSTDSYTMASQWWELFQNQILFVIAFVMALETITNFYKASRNRR